MLSDNFASPSDASTPNNPGVKRRNSMRKSFTWKGDISADLVNSNGVKKSRSIDYSFELSNSAIDGSSLYEWRTFNENYAALVQNKNMFLCDQSSTASPHAQERLSHFEELFRENVNVLYSEVLNALNNSEVSQDAIDSFNQRHTHLMECVEKILSIRLPHLAKEVSSRLDSVKALLKALHDEFARYLSCYDGGTCLQQFRKWLQDMDHLLNRMNALYEPMLTSEQINMLSLKQQVLLGEIECRGRFLLNNARNELLRDQQNQGQQDRIEFKNPPDSIDGHFYHQRLDGGNGQSALTNCNSERRQRILFSLENRWKRLRLKALESAIQLDSHFDSNDQASSSSISYEPPVKRTRFAQNMNSDRLDTPLKTSVDQPLISSLVSSVCSDVLPFGDSEYESIETEKPDTLPPLIDIQRHSDNGYSSECENDSAQKLKAEFVPRSNADLRRKTSQFNDTQGNASLWKNQDKSAKFTESSAATRKFGAIKCRSTGTSPGSSRRNIVSRFDDSPVKEYYKMLPDDVTDSETAYVIKAQHRRSDSENGGAVVSSFNRYFSRNIDDFHNPAVEMTDSLMVNVSASKENLNDESLHEVIALLDENVGEQEQQGLGGHANFLALQLEREMQELFPFEIGTTWKPFGGGSTKNIFKKLEEENVGRQRRRLDFPVDSTRHQSFSDASSEMSADENNENVSRLIDTEKIALKRRLPSRGIKLHSDQKFIGHSFGHSARRCDSLNNSLEHSRPLRTPNRRTHKGKSVRKSHSCSRALSESPNFFAMKSRDSDCVKIQYDTTSSLADVIELSAISPITSHGKTNDSDRFILYSTPNATPDAYSVENRCETDIFSLGARSCTESDRSDSLYYEWDDYKPPKHCEYGRPERKLEDSNLTDFGDDYRIWIDSTPPSARSDFNGKLRVARAHSFACPSNRFDISTSTGPLVNRKSKNRLKVVQKRFGRGYIKNLNKLCIRCHKELGLPRLCWRNKCHSADAIYRMEKFLIEWKMESGKRKRAETSQTEILQDIIKQFKDSLTDWHSKILENSEKSQCIPNLEARLKNNISELKGLCLTIAEQQKTFRECLKIDVFSQCPDLKDIESSFQFAAESCQCQLKALEDVQNVLLDWKINEASFKDLSSKLKVRLADCGSLDSLLDGDSFCSGDSSHSDDMKAINNDVQCCKQRLAALERLCSRLANVQSTELTLKDDLLADYRCQLAQYKKELVALMSPCGTSRLIEKTALVGDKSKSADDDLEFELIDTETLSKRKTDGLTSIDESRRKRVARLKNAFLFALPLPICVLIVCLVALYLAHIDVTCQGDSWNWFWGFRLDYINGPPPT